MGEHSCIFTELSLKRKRGKSIVSRVQITLVLVEVSRLTDNPYCDVCSVSVQRMIDEADSTAQTTHNLVYNSD